jgi:hypothetical protein
LRIEHDRYLDDHRVDGRPVLPFAAAMELMAEGAAAVASRVPTVLSSVRLLKGITIEDAGGLEVRIDAAAAGGSDALALTLSSPGGGRVHYQALAGFAPQAASAVSPPDGLDDARPFPMSVTDAYRDLLFHGPLFQGIETIAGMDERGATAQLHPSAPGACVRGGHGEAWLLDPVLIDCALQMQLLWTRLHWEVTLLPSELSAYTRLGAVPTEGLVRHELRIRPCSEPPLCRADHWFFTEDDRLVATLTDMVGVGARALNRLAARV